MFEAQSPENYHQKCLCVLVLDISGSMDGEPINELNRGLQRFQQEVLEDFTASQRLEISIITFSNSVHCIQEPALMNRFEMPVLAANGTTKLADAMNMAMEQIEGRKKWYRSTGQNFYRPLLVLITDGEPDQDQDMDSLSVNLTNAIAQKKLLYFGLGVKGYNHQKLSSISPSSPPKPLDEYKFAEFFKWLSNSIGAITKSKEGEMLALPPIDSWTQIQI